ncbi:MAG: FAD-dependent oxidoreductase [Beijerinckiaceae bacterium]
MLDLLIVGAGPAGMRAAIEAAARGLSVVVIDEGQAPGGQIYREALAGPFAVTGELGPDYAKGHALTLAFEAASLVRRRSAAVFMIERNDEGGFLVGVAPESGQAERMRARALIVATGAHERPMPIPGWTLPGVMTAGAAQTLLKSSAIAPDGSVVLAGMGPLLYLLAAQYARLGVRMAALLDTTPAGNWRRALPRLPGFLLSSYARKGAGLLAEALRSTTVHRGVTDLRAEGGDRLSAVRFTAGGRSREIAADALLLHQGVVPQVNLTMAAGARHVWNDDRRAFEPQRDPFGESSVEGLFIAGDTGGIGGADAAEAEGAIAALGVLKRLGRWSGGDDAALAPWSSRRAASLRGRAFLDALYRPNDAQVAPADDVIVCRCEEITAGEIRESVRRGARGPNQAKAFTRAGMGPCQGRMCGLTVNAVIAAEARLPPEAVGYMRIRMPVKPVTVAQMAGMQPDER